ncbi:hypothetical protein ACVBEQ_08080 [Nakamurella sp. GG22]
MPTPHPVPPAAPRAVLATARRIAEARLRYGYFRPINAATAPYVYCPQQHKVEATVPAGASAAQVSKALRVALTNHLIDNSEAPAGR